VKAKVKIPVSVKLPPFLSATANFIAQLESSGADGVVLFNRFFRPDFDLETLSVKREVALSTPSDIHLPLTWIALLSRHLRLSLAAGTGVDSHVEVVKFLLAGADVVATASALLRHGPEHMMALVDGLERWLSQNGFVSVAEIPNIRMIAYLARFWYTSPPPTHRGDSPCQPYNPSTPNKLSLPFRTICWTTSVVAQRPDF